MRNRDVLNSPRLSELKKRRRKIFMRKVLLYIFLVVAFLFALSYISRISRVNINNIEVAGNKIIEAQNIKEVVGEKLSGRYFWVFPKSNIFYYPKNEIQDELRRQFTRLKDIKLSIKDEKTLQISVSERIPVYLWCGENASVSEGEKACYFLDDSGYIFDQAPFFSGAVYYRFYGKANPASYFSPEIFSKLITFKKTLEDLNLSSSALEVGESGDIRILLLKKTGSAQAEIILKSDADFSKITENLEAAIATQPLKSDLQNKYSSLLYIDLRYGNKVYYKFR